jgi:Ca2+/H+ antiporter, TMEM165/GDT1 family
MSGFMIAFLAVLLAGFGARDQLTLASLSRAQGQSPALLVVAVVISCATAAFAAWASILIAPLMVSNARLMMVALVLGLAGLECWLQTPPRAAQEPTRSLAALAIVLASQQMTDSARFLIFAIAIAVNAPVPAGLGGAVGGIALLGAAWAAPEHFVWRKLRKVRRWLSVPLLLLAVYLGLTAAGLL